MIHCRLNTHRQLNKTFVRSLILTLLITGSIFFTLNPFFGGTAVAAINQQINYQGKLTDSSNITVADGTYTMVFKLYTVSSGGSPIWTETRNGGNKVQVTSGLFSVMLGSVTALTGIDFNQTLYLGVTIESDGEMTPRKILGAVPASFETLSFGNATSTQYVRADQAGSISASSTQNVLSIIQTGSGNALGVTGNGTFTGTLTASNLSGTNTGNVTLAGENYLSIAGQIITALSVNLSGSNATGTLAAGRFPALTGDITTSAGSLTTAYNGVVPINKGGTNATSQTTNGVNYFDGTKITSGSSLIFDGTKLGIGVSPSAPLHIQSAGGANSGIRLENTSAGSYSTIDFYTPSGLSGQFVSTGASFSNGLIGGDQTVLANELTNGALQMGALGTNGYVTLFTGGLTPANERFRITSSGNVGIGTTTPNFLLSVAGTSNFTNALNFNGAAGSSGNILQSNGSGSAPTWVATSTLGFLSSSITTALSDGFIPRWNGTSLVNSLHLDNGTVAGINATSSSYTFNVQGTAGVNPFNVASSTGTSLFTILNSGNVGVGTNSPSVRLDIVDSGTSTSFTSQLNITNSSNTVNNYRGIAFLGDQGGSFAHIGVQLTASNVSSRSADLVFGTRSGIPASAERMRLTSGGNLGIGTSTPGFLLTVAGTSNFTNAMNFNGAAGSLGNILLSNGSGSAPTWTATSSLGLQPSGNYITALTGDVTASGPGSVAATLATVNGNVGSFGSSTAIPTFTVNAKGLITAASSNAVIAPAGTLTGTTLASNVVTSSLTTVGTIGTGVWQGTAVGPTFGGTGQNTYATGDMLYASGVNTLSKRTIGSTGDVLWVTSGGVPAWTATSTLGFLSSSITSSLSNGFIPRWNGSALINSIIRENGTVAGINATSSSYTFNVQGTAGVDPFNIASSTGTSLFTVLGNGNVGIGTTAPAYPLDIRHSGYFAAHFQNTTASASQTSFYMENDRGSFNSYGGFLYGSSAGNLGNLFGAARTDALFMFADGSFNLGMYVGTLQAQPFIIGTNNIERVRVNSSGNVGIGTTTPGYLLTVAGTSNFTNALNFNGAAGSSGNILQSAGSGSAPSWVATSTLGLQPAGNYITALTGDVTASGPGNVAATLATVNSNVGSFGSSTAIPSFTVNAKGLITAASSNAVIAPAGTLTGTTLAANVVSSSLTSVGTIGTGVWQGTAVGPTFGGTGQTTYATGDMLYASGSNTLAKRTIGSTGDVLWVTSGGVPAWTATSSLGFLSSSITTALSNGFIPRWNGTSLVNSLHLDNGTVAGINATSSSYTFNVQGTAGVNPFNVASSTGTSLFTVLNSGNVGIGTTTPLGVLSVKGAGAGTGVNFTTTNSSNTQLFTILDNGKVGIGTTTPAYALQVQRSGAQSDIAVSTDVGVGSANSTSLSFVSASNSGSPSFSSIGQFNTADLKFSAIGNLVSPQMTLTTGGNLGIGTTTPGFLLTVAGTSNFTNALNFNGVAGSAGNILQSNGSGSAPSWLATSTLASTLAVPANLLTGTTLASNVVTSSLTSVGTIGTGVWQGTAVGVGFGGTGQTSYTNGQLLIGNTTGNTLTKATLTGTSNQVIVTNGAGAITLSTPQNIGTTSSPTFSTLNIANGSTYSGWIGNFGLGSDWVGFTADGAQNSAKYAFVSTPSFGETIFNAYGGGSAPFIDFRFSNGAVDPFIRMYGSGGFFYGPSGSAADPGLNNFSIFSGKLGVGVVSPSAKLHVIATSSLARFGYDASNYFTADVSSVGATTFDAVGSGAKFIFNDTVGIGTSTPTASFTVAGHGFFAGGLGIGDINSATGTVLISKTLSASSTLLTLDNKTNTANDTRLDFTVLGGTIPVSRIASVYPSSNNIGLAFSTFNASGLAERMRIDKDGKVGIGTNSPQSFLDVSTTGSASVNSARFLVPALSSGNGTDLYIGRSANTGEAGTLGYYYNSSTNNSFLALGNYGDNVSGGEGLYVKKGGNVGIGTTAPQGALSVASANIGGHATGISAWSNKFSLFGLNAGSATGANLALGYDTTDDSSAIISLAPNVAWKPLYFDASSYNYYLAGASSPSLTMNSSGDVGIGTTTPASRLHVLSTTEQLRVGFNASNYYKTTVSFAGGVTFDAVGSVPNFLFSDSVTGASTIKANTGFIYANGSNLTDSSSSLYYGIGTQLADSAANLYYGNGVQMSDSFGLLYYGDGAGILVDDNSNIFGRNEIFATNLPVSNGHFASDALCLQDQGFGPEITVNTGAIDCNVSSQRFKSNIQTANQGLDEIMAMRPVSFVLSGDDPNNVHAGFIAEEMEKLDHRLVFYGNDGLVRGVRYEEITSVLAKAIQDQQKIIMSNASTTAAFAASTVSALSSLELRVGSLEGLTANVGGGSSFNVGIFGDLLATLQSFGTEIVDNISYMKNFFVEHFTAQNLTIKGKDVTKTGFTIYDRGTGDPVCVYFENGEMKNSEGECPDSTATTTAPETIDHPSAPDNPSPDLGEGSSTPSDDLTPPSDPTPPADDIAPPSDEGDISSDPAPSSDSISPPAPDTSGSDSSDSTSGSSESDSAPSEGGGE